FPVTANPTRQAHFEKLVRPRSRRLDTHPAARQECRSSGAPRIPRPPAWWRRRHTMSFIYDERIDGPLATVDRDTLVAAL
ncbi:hypothetical protein SB768_33715, partial [Burkholderia sp. SIMBA_043]|uniref:hypothetical protein n=1 Tax=Burkholderia sp. SIMBA_043 TaxID=3085784 RepID=UPI00397A3755